MPGAGIGVTRSPAKELILETSGFRRHSRSIVRVSWWCRGTQTIHSHPAPGQSFILTHEDASTHG
jgi:hypothetical protein